MGWQVPQRIGQDSFNDEMNEPLCDNEFDSREGGRSEPHCRKAFAVPLVSTKTCCNEAIEFCPGFLVGELLVDL